ncbi:MAG: hypothetical protein IPQ24_04870 [Anaeromyxobacter sp.]|nr:hypothetical protein [Anaeromyxobacter sp.]
MPGTLPAVRTTPLPPVVVRRRAPLALRGPGALGLAAALTLALAACGGAATAPTYTVSVTVTSPLAAGETFRFVLQGTTSAVTVAQSGVPAAFAPSLAGGTAYVVNQTDGPRTCTLSASRSGTLTADVVVTAACGTPPGTSTLGGVLWGPIGVQVALQRNGADDLSVTVPPFLGGPAAINQQPFTFATGLLDGSAYQVSLTAQPAGHLCAVYAGATGTMPVAAGAVKVGCERLHDLASRSTDDAVRGTYFESSAPVLGGDAFWGEGRFVSFVSSAAGLAGASGAHRQIFWRDRFTGETRLLSADPAGVEGNGDSFAPAISADGLHVAFESHATNLVAGDTNGVRDVLLWAADNGTLPTSLERVSWTDGGVPGNAESFEPSVSADGAVVAFSSSASNLTPGVSGTSTTNVFRWVRLSGTCTLVSADAGGAGVGGARPALSEDGQRLAFWSFSSALVPGDLNGLWDVFVHDQAAGTSRVSLAQGGGERNQGVESASRVVAPAISGDGRFVAFATTASNLVAGDTNGAQDVFVVDTSTGAVARASLSDAGAQGESDSPIGQGERVALSADGAFVAFSSGAASLGAAGGQVLLRSLATGRTRVISTGATNGVGPPSLSRSAGAVAYGAGSPLDSRFASTGLFVSFTGLEPAYFWQ